MVTNAKGVAGMSSVAGWSVLRDGSFFSSLREDDEHVGRRMDAAVSLDVGLDASGVMEMMGVMMGAGSEIVVLFGRDRRKLFCLPSVRDEEVARDSAEKAEHLADVWRSVLP